MWTSVQKQTAGPTKDQENYVIFQRESDLFIYADTIHPSNFGRAKVNGSDSVDSVAGMLQLNDRLQAVSQSRHGARVKAFVAGDPPTKILAQLRQQGYDYDFEKGVLSELKSRAAYRLPGNATITFRANADGVLFAALQSYKQNGESDRTEILTLRKDAGLSTSILEPPSSRMIGNPCDHRLPSCP